MGYETNMGKLTEAQKQEQFNEHQVYQKKRTEKLVEKWGKKKGLELNNGKLASLVENDERKAGNFVRFLEATEKGVSHLKEYVTSGFASSTPQEIVKVARVGYPNSIINEAFDVWGMESVRDSFFKLESTYGNSFRGETADSVTYENYNEGRFPSEIEKFEVTVTATDTFTGTLDHSPLRPWFVKLYLNNTIIAQDNGSGVLVGALLDATGANTINYSTGVFALKFTTALVVSDELFFNYNYDSEQTALFNRTGTLNLNLVAYDFRAVQFPIYVSWSRMTEEIMESKLKTSARDSLLQSAGETMKKDLDELATMKAIQAANWTTPVTFDANFASAGSDNSISHAQSVLSAIRSAEDKTYDSLGRYAQKNNLFADSDGVTYLQKHKLYQPVSSQARIGIFKVGELDGRSIYQIPKSMQPTGASGRVYSFGKSANDSMNTDSVVSVGTWKTGMSTDELTFKNFNTEVGLMNMMDIKTLNPKMAVSVQLENLGLTF